MLTITGKTATNKHDVVEWDQIQPKPPKPIYYTETKKLLRFLRINYVSSN